MEETQRLHRTRGRSGPERQDITLPPRGLGLVMSERTENNDRYTTRHNSSRSNHKKDINTRTIVEKIIKLDPLEPIEKTLMNKQVQFSKNLNITIRTQKFELNKDRSLRRKQVACHRPLICETTENEGHIQISCQAGVYELLKRATLLYFSEIQHKGVNVDLELWQDKSLNHTQAVIKTTSQHNGKLSYAVNLYHTTSAIGVNGNGAAKFFQHDWPNIGNIITEINELCKGTEPEILNENMKECIDMALQALSKPKQKKQNRQIKGQQNNHPDSQLSRGMEVHSGGHLPVEYNIQQDSGNDARDTIPPPKEVAITPATVYNAIPIIGLDGMAAAAHHSGTGNTRASEDSQAKSSYALTTHTLPPAIPGQSETRTGQSNRINKPEAIHDIATHVQQMESPIEQVNHSPGETATGERVSEETSTVRCQWCIKTAEDKENTLREVQLREKKLASSEKANKMREKELDRLQLQLETQKAVIAGLERQVKELAATNRMLQQINEATGVPRNSNLDSRGDTNKSAEQEEIRRLKDELRMKDLETRITDRMYSMEHRVLNQIGQLRQGNDPIFNRGHNPPWPQVPQWVPYHVMPQPVNMSMPTMGGIRHPDNDWIHNPNIRPETHQAQHPPRYNKVYRNTHEQNWRSNQSLPRGENIQAYPNTHYKHPNHEAHRGRNHQVMQKDTESQDQPHIAKIYHSTESSQKENVNHTQSHQGQTTNPPVLQQHSTRSHEESNKQYHKENRNQWRQELEDMRRDPHTFYRPQEREEE